MPLAVPDTPGVKFPPGCGIRSLNTCHGQLYKKSNNLSSSLADYFFGHHWSVLEPLKGTPIKLQIYSFEI